MDIYEELIRLKREGRSSALTTIVQCQGSSPQKQGAKMLVRDDGSILGTLGGGCLEAEVIQTSLIAMTEGLPQTVPFELTERKGGLVCGGKVLVYIEPIVPEPHLVILGAGHVGKALSAVAKFSGFRVTVVDDRSEHANPEQVPHADDIIVSDFEGVFTRKAITDNTSFVVVATRGHNHDLEALKAALRTEARYIGLLGSKRKKALIGKALKDEGFSSHDINRVLTPVGLPICSVTPEEIAISIMAQIIQYRREYALAGVGDTPRGRVFEEDGTTETAPSLGKEAGNRPLS